MSTPSPNVFTHPRDNGRAQNECTPPPPTVAEKVVDSLCTSGEKAFFLRLTKSPLPLWYPRGQLHTKNLNRSSPGDSTENDVTPGGERRDVSSVLHSAPLRLTCNEQCPSVLVACCSLSHYGSAAFTQIPPAIHPRISRRCTTSSMGQEFRLI